LYSSTAVSDLDHRKLVIERSATLKPKTPKEQLRFGAQFTDHMLTVAWDKASGWDRPHIKPYQALQLDPASSVFHYGLECYEGMKVYMDGSGKLRMFRPIENMNRFNRSCARLVLPTLNAEALLECIKELVRLDRDWVPQGKGYSLYIRPCMISTYSFLGVAAAGNALCFVILSPVGPYYRSGWRPVKLLADTKYVRAWPGGTGNAKVGGNYGATVLAQKEAEERGYNQILWLYGPNNEITEVGTMNMFVAIRGKNGEKELVTAPATPQGVVLSGITRDSIIQLVRKLPDWRVSERACPIAEIIEAQEEGRLIEAFGCGTAAVVSPIESVTFRDKVISFPLGPMGKAGELTQRLSDTLTSIQYGEVPHEWSVAID
jgi:branched-chain amino acid aminotransferase